MTAADPSLREQLAKIEHTRWAAWQKWVHSVCSRTDEGEITIPGEFYDGWERQIATPYEILREQDLDRKEADTTLAAVAAWLRTDEVHALMLAHLKVDIGHCRCGWADLGKSHPRHVAAALADSLESLLPAESVEGTTS